MLNIDTEASRAGEVKNSMARRPDTFCPLAASAGLEVVGQPVTRTLVPQPGQLVGEGHLFGNPVGKTTFCHMVIVAWLTPKIVRLKPWIHIYRSMAKARSLLTAMSYGHSSVAHPKDCTAKAMDLYISIHG